MRSLSAGGRRSLQHLRALAVAAPLRTPGVGSSERQWVAGSLGGARAWAWRAPGMGMATRADARPGGGPDKGKWKAETKVDNAAAVKTMQAQAEAGDVGSQYTLGAALMRGQLGLQKNPTEASKWLLKAADAGNVHAQFSMGVLLSEGDGVAKDEAKAAQYFTLAAEANLAAAQYHLGCCYEKGAGVEQDFGTAAILFARAVAQQHEQSSLKLALCYIAGRGVEQDYPRAVNLLNRPANNGIAEAQFVLGYLHLNGEGGVQQDKPHAISLMEAAGNSGFLKVGANSSGPILTFIPSPYVHTCIRAYMHTCIHAYTLAFSRSAPSHRSLRVGAGVQRAASRSQPPLLQTHPLLCRHIAKGLGFVGQGLGTSLLPSRRAGARSFNLSPHHPPLALSSGTQK